MSFFKIAPEQVETFTIVTNPFRSFVTSTLGATGSVFVSARRSPAEKDVQQVGTYDTPFGDDSLQHLLQDVQNAVTTSTNIYDKVASYMQGVHNRGQSRRNTVSLPIERFVPTPTFTENTLRKNSVQKLLFPYYRVDYPTAHWAYTNYHSMNFFTSSMVPTGSALLYPNVVDAPVNGTVSGSYVLTGAFTFDFYVNPRFRSKNSENFKASTLLHLSSCFAISLVSGSQRDYNGNTQGYRMMLQLSHSADIAPSIAQHGNFPSDLVFVSDDNSLQFNTWHHVVIRWGTSSVNHGTGTFWIDQVPRGVFVIPSSTIAPRSFTASGSTPGNPDVMCVGNYYEGNNKGSNALANFFATNPSQRYGLEELLPDVSIERPDVFSFRHPFNAEFHDLAIKTGYVPDDIVVSGSGVGLNSLDDTLFYLPPFFTTSSPYRKFVGDSGGVLQTPFFAADGYTDDPFNVALAFGVGGHYMNLENFTQDFATGRYPIQLELTASEILGTADTARSANEFLYDCAQIRRRNVTVLPCDDGNFIPNFRLLATSSNISYVDDLGGEDLSLISLNDMIPTGTLFNFITDETGSMFTQLAGASPESPGIEPGSVLTIFQRLRDNSSNQVTFFDISNLYYGLRIKPGTFVLSDFAITGTAGALGMSLSDDGFGNLYRSDCVSPHATWNSVGNILYNEGIVVVKSPHLQFFGKEGYSLSFQGEQTIHTLRVNVFAQANTLNSSSNANYLPVSASMQANEIDDKFVHITDVYMMDKNFNVVMKTALAQPIMKRSGDTIMFKIKCDF